MQSRIRGSALFRGTHHNSELHAQKKPLLRDYFLKDLEGLDSPLFPKKLSVFLLCI